MNQMIFIRLDESSYDIFMQMQFAEIKYLQKDDKVDYSNLHRQTLYDYNDVGKYKSDVIKKKITFGKHETYARFA